MKSFIRILGILFVFCSTTHIALSQKYYESSFPELQDEIYYPKIDKYINMGNWDSIISIASEAFNYYYDKNNINQALYLYNLGMYYPSGYGLAEKCLPLIVEKENFLRGKVDTLNVHYGMLVLIHATANIRLFDLEVSKPIFAKSISILEKSSNKYPLLLFDAIRSAAFLHVYLFDNIRGYHLANEALHGFLSIDTASKNNNLKTKIIHDIAYSYITLAVLMKQTKQIELSLAYNQKAFNTFASLGYAKENMAVTKINAADNYIELNKPKQALEAANAADSIITANDFKKKLKTSYISVLSNKGKAFMGLKDYPKADSVFRKLLYFMNENFEENAPIISDAYINIAGNFSKMGKVDSAIRYYKKALKFQESNFKTYSSIATLQASIGNYQSGTEFLEKYLVHLLKDTAINIQNSVPRTKLFKDIYKGSKVTHNLANYYLELYHENNSKDYLAKSLAYIKLSDSLMENHINSTLIGGDDLEVAKEYHNIASTGIKAFYLSSANKKDEEQLSSIFTFFSKSTAFKLNAEVNQSRYFINSMDESIRARQFNLLKQLKSVENKLLVAENTDNKYLAEQLSEQLFNLRKDAFDITFSLQNFDTVSRQTNENFKATIGNIKENLNEEDVLISYFIVKDELFSLVIKKTSAKVYGLKIGKEFHSLLNVFYKNVKTNSKELFTSGEKLYQYLILPIEKEISNSKHLIIIPDGKLNQIPFDALTKNKNGKSRFLIEDYSISYNYSIPIWLNSKVVKSKNSSDLSFVGFAPVFMDNQEIDSLNPLSYNDELRSSYLEIRKANKLKPLKHSDKEVKGIQNLFKNKGKHSIIFTHKNADEETFKNKLKGFSIVHIATHGYSSKSEPNLSGLFVSENDKSSDITNDGFIHLNEIFTQNSDADLVVLSACKTGTGQIHQGEGVLALPRAFIFAGVPNLVASLWKVHDEKTKNLMIDFYSEIIDGKTYAEALRLAKLEQIKQGVQPIDWCSFILIGI